MEVITTTEQLKNYNESIYNNTIAYLAMERKNKLDEFHSGHELCVATAKQNADVVMVSFLDSASIFNNIYPEYGIVFNRKGIKEICLQWCSNQDVDLVLYPDPGIELSWVESYNLNDLKNWVDQQVAMNGYFAQDNAKQVIMKATIMFEKIRVDLGLDRRDVRIGSSKDGSWRLCTRHFFKNFINKPYIIIDSLINPNTGFPYTSSLFDPYITPQKDFLLQLPDLIDANKSQIGTNVDQYKQNLLLAINSLDSSGTFYALKVDVFYNISWVDAGKALIEIPLHVNNRFKMQDMEGYCVYCKYIDL